MAPRNEARSMFVVFFILAVAIIITIVYALMSNQAGEGQQIVGADEDEHGCKASAGYSWCESKEKCLRTWEEECPVEVSGEVFIYLEDLKAAILKNSPETEISEVNQDTFDWLMNDAGMVFADGRIGASLKLKNISNELLEGVKVQLEADGFEIDANNITAGTSVSRSGYKNDKLVCVLNEEVMNMALASETVPALYRLEIYCATK